MTSVQAADGFVSGIGKQSCAQVLLALEDKSLSQEAFSNWLQGYFSGANVAYGARSKIGDVTTGSTLFPEKITALVLTQCQAKPDDLLGKAAYETYFQLRQAGQ